MSSTVYCSHCGKELSANLRFCTACGTPVPAASVQAQIEQKLHPTPAAVSTALYGVSSAAQPPILAPADAPAATPAVCAAQPVLTAEESAPPVSPNLPEYTQTTPTVGHAFVLLGVALRTWARRHLRPLLIGSGVAAALILVLILSLTLGGLGKGYHASPERLIEGAMEAVRTQDKELYISLLDPAIQKRYEASGNMFYLPASLDIQILDKLEGSKGQFVILYVSLQYPNPLEASSTLIPSTRTISVQKQDGYWYLDSSMTMLY